MKLIYAKSVRERLAQFDIPASLTTSSFVQFVNSDARQEGVVVV